MVAYRDRIAGYIDNQAAQAGSEIDCTAKRSKRRPARSFRRRFPYFIARTSTRKTPGACEARFAWNVGDQLTIDLTRITREDVQTLGSRRALRARAPPPIGEFSQSSGAFEAKVKADGGAELLRLVHEKLDLGAEPPAEGRARVPDLSATGPRGRTARTALALREATGAPGVWTLLDHPMLALDVAGSPAFLEPDAVVVHPDGSWTVVEIKSFPMLDGSADPAKIGAAARQAAVYVLALERVAARLEPARACATGSRWCSPTRLPQPAHRVRRRVAQAAVPSPTASWPG